MRKYFYFLSVLLLSVSFFSCSSDDDGDNESNGFYGKWYLFYVEYTTSSIPNVNYSGKENVPTLEITKTEFIETDENGVKTVSTWELNDKGYFMLTRPDGSEMSYKKEQEYTDAPLYLSYSVSTSTKYYSVTYLYTREKR